MPTAPARTEDALGRELGVYLDHLRAERGLAPNTLGAYRRDLLRYVRFLASLGLGDVLDVRPAVVGDFVAALREGSDGGAPLTASSAARTASAVRGWHRFLLDRGRSIVDPARDVRPGAPPRRPPATLTVAQVARLLQGAGDAGGALGLRDQALLEVLYGTGARISEVVGLDLADVPVTRAGAGVRLGGTAGGPRTVPLGPAASGALSAYLLHGRPQLSSGDPVAVFLNTRGGRLSRQSAWVVLRSAAERAGLPEPVGPHTLRHSSATHLLAEGMDVRSLQRRLGHASVSSTLLYAAPAAPGAPTTPPGAPGARSTATRVVAAPAVGAPGRPGHPNAAVGPPGGPSES